MIKIKKVLVVLTTLQLVSPAYCRELTFKPFRHAIINYVETILVVCIEPCASIVGNAVEFLIEHIHLSFFSYVILKKAATQSNARSMDKLKFDSLQVIKQGLGYAAGEMTTIAVRTILTLPNNGSFKNAISSHFIKGVTKGIFSKVIKIEHPYIPNPVSEVLTSGLSEGIADTVKRVWKDSTIRIDVLDVSISALTGGILKKGIMVSWAKLDNIQNKETLYYHGIAVVGDLSKQLLKSLFKPKIDMIDVEFYSYSPILKNSPNSFFMMDKSFLLEEIIDNPNVIRHYNGKKVIFYLSDESNYDNFHIVMRNDIKEEFGEPNTESVLINISFMSPSDMIIHLSALREEIPPDLLATKCASLRKTAGCIISQVPVSYSLLPAESRALQPLYVNSSVPWICQPTLNPVCYDNLVNSIPLDTERVFRYFPANPPEPELLSLIDNTPQYKWVCSRNFSTTPTPDYSELVQS